MSDEEARDRAITFLMSVGEKRAYENKKKEEKEFMERFKSIFATIVEKHLVNEARTMKVIDMTNAIPMIKPEKLVSKSKLPGKKLGSAIKVDTLDFDQIEEERAVMPKPLLAYHKHMAIVLAKQ